MRKIHAKSGNCTVGTMKMKSHSTTKWNKQPRLKEGDVISRAEHIVNGGLVAL